jgi:hypothetical protein
MLLEKSTAMERLFGRVVNAQLEDKNRLKARILKYIMMSVTLVSGVKI